MDEDARQHEELREQYNLQERRLSLTQTELEEMRTGLEGSERSRKLLEQELLEITERHNEINVQVKTNTTLLIQGRCTVCSAAGIESLLCLMRMYVPSLRLPAWQKSCVRSRITACTPPRFCAQAQ